MKIFLPQCALIVTLVFLPLISHAQSYKVTPRIIDREVKQRDIFSETISITNNKTHKINLYASVNAVNVNEGGDITNFTPPSMSDNTLTVTSWISISRGRLSVESGQTIEVPLSFKIHPNAEPGVYHAFIGFGTGTNRPEAEQQVQNGLAPGVVVTLSVDQDKHEFLKLSRFIIDRFVTKPDNTAITYTLDNPGDVDIVPKGEIIFSNGRGKEVAALTINPEGQSLAPGQESTFTVAAPTEGLIGKYKAFLAVDYGTAQLASVYDTAFFYVLPWQKLLLLFGVILMMVVFTTIVLHRRFVGNISNDDDHDELPVFIRKTRSEDKEHDINLKK